MVSATDPATVGVPEAEAAAPAPVGDADGAATSAGADAGAAEHGSSIVLDRGDTRYHVVGTAHVSQASVDEVRATILRLRPEVVCVELCQGRYDALTEDRSFRNLDIFKVIREGKTLYLLAHLGLASYQRRMGAALGVKPGAELLAAVEAAREVGARVELVDRDIHTTLKRTWANIGLWKRSTLLASLVVGWDDDDDKAGEVVTAESIEKLKEQRALSEMLAELSKAMPEVKVPLIDERDAYLASGIEAAGQGVRNVVAVVGAAHVPGIRSTFGQVVDRAVLERIPPPAWWWTALKWLVPALLVAAFIWGWRSSSSASFAQMMLAWIVPTSAGAGVLTLLGGGRLLTVLAAILVAPIAAIHPLLGTGMVVGVVEAYLRKPSVADCERLPDDIQTLRGFWRNPVTRILLIAVLSGIGTAAGFWVGVGYVASIV
ncbi:MAG: TraB family protein [Kofleriaceae bacterium]|nr:TraB family protein [Kofleriaceae bacterium]MBP6837106.1 TraB family protein [Kofleriaceae bacterium]